MKQRLSRIVLLSALLAVFATAAADAATVYVARRGWHIDIGISVADLTPPLTLLAADLPAARSLFFGFGDRRYLLAPHRNAPVLLGALWPGAGMMLVTGIAGAPGAAFGAEHLVTLQLDSDQMQHLQAFIVRSLQSERGEPARYGSGPYEDSAYYLASADYSAVHTCNTWAAQAMRAAGFKVHVKGVIFAGQLWSQARRLERSQARGASLLKP